MKQILNFWGRHGDPGDPSNALPDHSASKTLWYHGNNQIANLSQFENVHVYFRCLKKNSPHQKFIHK